MYTARTASRIVLLALLALAAPARHAGAQSPSGDGSSSAESVPTPEAYFGFSMGADKKLARWDEILRYLTLVAERSPRIRVDTLGPTTLGNPFVVVTLSSPENLARLDEIRAASARLASGRIPRSEAERIAREHPVTAFINHNIHSTEIASSQTSVDLVYRLAAADDEVTRLTLDHVVTVLIPSANPDGQIMVTDWYRRNVDTPYERARMPWLYHRYAGHDNNRDFFQANLVETRYWMQAMYHTAYPQLYLDQHQMGRGGPRMFVPPYPDPMNPDIHPHQWQQLRFMGGGIVADLQEAGKQGVVTGAMYRIWGQEGALTGRYHNIVALLTETASARIASPDTVSLETLERGARPGRGLARYGFQMAFVDPWPGGVWRLGDIVAYQNIAAMSYLEQAARFHQHYAFGRWLMASETLERARREGPFAYVIPADQADPVAAAEMVTRLALQGVEAHRAREAFRVVPAGADGAPDDGGAETRTVPAGSWIVYGTQPGWAAVLDLLEPRSRELLYEWPGGPYMRSYDGAAYTMPMQMGVEALRVDEPFEADASPVEVARVPAPALPDADRWYAWSARITRAYQVANELLDAGVEVQEGRADGADVFLVAASAPGAAERLRSAVERIGIPVTADPTEVTDLRQVQRLRVGLYQGWAASMDEGWTRYMLEDFAFPYASLSNEDVRDPELGARLDVVILPAQIPLERLIEGATGEETPPEYRGGIGEEGVANLERFVREGGTLITLERADELVIQRFGVPVRDAVADAGEPEFFLPASLLKIELDPEHDLAFGNPVELAAKWAGGRAYEPSDFDGPTGRIRAVARWARDPDEVLMSGLLVGPELLAGKGAVLDVEFGRGRILMYGFRVQHRAQTQGTFRLLFRALLGSRAAPAG